MRTPYRCDHGAMASRLVEVAAGELKERLIAAVESNDVDKTRQCIQAGGDPNAVFDLLRLPRPLKVRLLRSQKRRTDPLCFCLTGWQRSVSRMLPWICRDGGPPGREWSERGT